MFTLLIEDLQKEFQQDLQVAGISSLESGEAAASRCAQGIISLQSPPGTAATETSYPNEERGGRGSWWVTVAWRYKIQRKPASQNVDTYLNVLFCSNFRRKEPLYLFIQALFVSGTYTGFRDLLFSLLFPAKNISSTMMRQKVR